MIVYTGGTFDLWHAGHVAFLRRCAALGRVTVALNTDDFVRRYKHHDPTMPYAEREAIVSACRYVERVIPNLDGEDSTVTIELVGPDIIAIGDDWRDRDYHGQMGFTPEWLEQRGISLVYLPYGYRMSGESSSALLRRIRETALGETR